MWPSIFDTHGSVRQGFRRRIGNGETTRIWQVPWLPCKENEFLDRELPRELESTLFF